MKPTTSSDLNKKTCSSIISASCVLWHGPDLDCIDTCKGDSMVDVIEKISIEVCALKETLTFTSLQFDCLDDSCTGCTLCSDDDKILKNILECIIKKYCALKIQVDAIPLVPSDGVADCPTTFNIDLNCLESLAGRSLPTAPTNDQILQLIADAVCISYDDLLARIDQLNIDLIACCNSGGGTSTVPQVNSSCLFVGLKGIDEAYIILDGDYCDLKTLVGDYGDLADSYNPAVPCSTQINDFLSLTIGGAFTLDASLTNIYDVLCALSAKLEIIEAVQAQCCSFSCDDIEVQVIGSVSDPDLELVTLVITFNGSIGFPPEYPIVIDMGSTVTFTDKNGTISPVLAIDILDDLTYTDMDLSYLDLSDDLAMTLNIKFKVTDAFGIEHTCYKCITGLVPINNDCAFCTLTVNSGTDVNLKITYTFDGNTNIIIISSNGSYFIPRGAVITSIVDESTVSPSITTDCTQLVIPDPLELNCWMFIIPSHLFNNTTTADPENELEDFYVRALIVGGIRYPLSVTIPAHLGVKGTDECPCADPPGGAPLNMAYTSLADYAAGGLDYQYNPTLEAQVANLNIAIGTNPVIKRFTSACTNHCDVCMTHRFLHIETYGPNVPYLELDLVTGALTTIVQIQGESNDVAGCKCDGE